MEQFDRYYYSGQYWEGLLYPTGNVKVFPFILDGKIEHLADGYYDAVDYYYWIDMEKEIFVIEGLGPKGREVVIPFKDFKEGLLDDLRAYGGQFTGTSI